MVISSATGSSSSSVPTVPPSPSPSKSSKLLSSSSSSSSFAMNRSTAATSKLSTIIPIVGLIVVWWGATAQNSVSAKHVASSNPHAVPLMAFVSSIPGGIGYVLFYLWDKTLLRAFTGSVSAGGAGGGGGNSKSTTTTTTTSKSTTKTTTTTTTMILPYLATCHGIGILAAYMGLVGARVSLVQAVKAMEPLLAMILTIYFSQQIPSLSLLVAAMIVVCGVMIVCVTDTTYTWIALSWTVTSSIFTQCRNQFMKQQQSYIQSLIQLSTSNNNVTNNNNDDTNDTTINDNNDMSHKLLHRHDSDDDDDDDNKEEQDDMNTDNSTSNGNGTIVMRNNSHHSNGKENDDHNVEMIPLKAMEEATSASTSTMNGSHKINNNKNSTPSSQPQQQQLSKSAQLFFSSSPPQWLIGLIMFVVVSAYALPINAILIAIMYILQHVTSSSSSSTITTSPQQEESVSYDLIVASVCHFLYNLASFGVLSLVTPSTHSLANTTKRAVVVGFAAIVLKETATQKMVLGLSITITGSFLYAAQKQKELSTASTSSTTSSRGSAINARLLILLGLVFTLTFGILNFLSNMQKGGVGPTGLTMVGETIEQKEQHYNNNENEIIHFPDTDCIYSKIQSCLLSKDNSVLLQKEQYTLAELDGAVDDCVRKWSKNVYIENINNKKKKEDFPFNLLQRGGVKDRVDWSVFRLGLTKEAKSNVQFVCSGSTNISDNTEQPKTTATMLHSIPSWWDNVDTLPPVSRRYITGGVYLPPFYQESDEDEKLPNGFFLPRGPVRLAQTPVVDGKFRPKVYESEPNLGDCYNHYLLSILAGRNARKILTGPKVCAVGSIAGSDCDIIWGAGKISLENANRAESHTEEVFATRGPNTKKVYSKKSKHRIVFGDPGLLAPLIYPVPSLKNGESNSNNDGPVDLCIVPHYIDQKLPAVRDALLKQKSGSLPFKIRFINIMTCDLERYMQHMIGCKRIVSSSLHGLIFGLANGIPGFRVMLSDRVLGKHYKFEDFYGGIGHPELYIYESLQDSSSIPFEKLLSKFETKNITAPPINAEDLWNANPIHAEAMGKSRRDHVAYVKYYIKHLPEEYPYKPYKELTRLRRRQRRLVEHKSTAKIDLLVID